MSYLEAFTETLVKHFGKEDPSIIEYVRTNAKSYIKKILMKIHAKNIQDHIGDEETTTKFETYSDLSDEMVKSDSNYEIECQDRPQFFLAALAFASASRSHQFDGITEVFLNKCIEHYPDNATPYYFSVFWQRKPRD